MAQLTHNGVAILKKMDRIGQPEGPTPVVAQVLHLHRFLVDRTFTSVTGIELPRAHDGEGYDVTLSDGVRKCKCLLHPLCNSFVQMGELQRGSVIRIPTFHARYDETVLDGHTMVILDSVEILERQRGIVLLLLGANEESSITFPPSCTRKETEERPLVGSRGYYLPVHRDDTCVVECGGVWDPKEPEQPPPIPIPVDYPTIAGILADYPTIVIPPPPIVGRVMRKTAVRHYGDASDAKDKWPFQFSFGVADNTAEVACVVWNSLVAEYFHQIQVGDVVSIHHYRAKRNYRRDDTLELALNPSNPAGKVLIHPEDVAVRLGLPGVQYETVAVREAMLLPDETEVDWLGVVFGVGPRLMERTMQGERLAEFRWVIMCDHQGGALVPFQLFVNSQPLVFDSIQHGDILMCTRVQLYSLTQDSASDRILYFKSSHTSQYIKHHCAYRDTPACQERLDQHSLRTGLSPFLIAPQKLPLFRQVFVKPAIVAGRDLAGIAARLRLKESVQMFVQVIIQSVELKQRRDGGDGPHSKRSAVHLEQGAVGHSPSFAVSGCPEIGSDWLAPDAVVWIMTMQDMNKHTNIRGMMITEEEDIQAFLGRLPVECRPQDLSDGLSASVQGKFAIVMLMLVRYGTGDQVMAIVDHVFGFSGDVGGQEEEEEEEAGQKE